MKNKFEHKGYFYLPASPEIKIAGTIYFHPKEKILLELFGDLNGCNDIFEVVELFTIKNTIHGLLSDGKEITLFNCQGSFTATTPCPFFLSSYTCQYLVIGIHISDLFEKQFQNVTFNLSHLYKWIGKRTIKFSIESNSENNPKESNFKISKEYFVENIFPIDPECDLHLISNSGFSTESNMESIHLEEVARIKISYRNKRESIMFFYNKIFLFRQFLELANLNTIDILDMSFQNTDKLNDEEKNKVSTEVNLYFKDNTAVFNPRNTAFLFNYSDIANCFGEIIKKWFEITPILAPIRNHLIDSIKSNGVFRSVDYLIVIQSLEGFHRRFINSKKVKLEDRLKELVVKFSFVDLVRNSNIDIMKVVKSRDYYSHFYDKDQNVLEGAKLFQHTVELRKLLICCVLNSIGFNDELTNEVINKYYN